MKRSTKWLVGLGAVAVAGTVAAVVVSEKVVEEVRTLKQRRQVKRFVQESLGGNERMLDLIDNLSDHEIETVVKLIHKWQAGKEKISMVGQNVGNTADEIKQTLTHYFTSKTAE